MLYRTAYHVPKMSTGMHVEEKGSARLCHFFNSIVLCTPDPGPYMRTVVPVHEMVLAEIKWKSSLYQVPGKYYRLVDPGMNIRSIQGKRSHRPAVNRGGNNGKRANGYHALCKVEYRPIGSTHS